MHPLPRAGHCAENCKPQSATATLNLNPFAPSQAQWYETSIILTLHLMYLASIVTWVMQQYCAQAYKHCGAQSQRFLRNVYASKQG